MIVILQTVVVVTKRYSEDVQRESFYVPADRDEDNQKQARKDQEHCGSIL